MVVSQSNGLSTTLKVVKLSDDATIPTRGSKHAAGLDLYSAENTTVSAKDRQIIKTDLQIELPNGCYGRVAPRSGLALKKGIDVGAGVVDEDYRGNLGVILFNFGHEDFLVKKGDRIAQLICEKVFYPEVVEVSELKETDRGECGYGSTGV